MKARLTALKSPHNRAIQIAHAARLTLESLNARPISHANKAYAQACLGNLDALADSASTICGHLIDTHQTQAKYVAKAIRDVCIDPTSSRVTETARFIRDDFHLYSRLMRTELESADMPKNPFLLSGRQRIRRVLVSIGPGIGIGDETKVQEMLLQMQRHLQLDEDTLTIFSCCPAIWQTLSTWKTVDLRADPLAVFHEIEASEPEPPGTTLIVFVNFLRSDTVRTFLPYSKQFSIMDVVVGNGEARLLSYGSKVELKFEGDSQGAPISEAMWKLSDHLFPGSAPERPLAIHGNRIISDEPLRIVISPFTSKKSPLTALDWSEYVAACARTLSPKRLVVCEIVPGLTEACFAHAEDIRRLIEFQLKDRATVILIGQDAVGYTTDNAIARVYRSIEGADLVLGIDTFTAHLAAKAGTVSIALCLNQNERFWDPSLRSLWFNLEAGPNAVALAVRTVTRLLDVRGRRTVPLAGFVLECKQLMHGLCHEPEDVALQIEPIWQSLPEPVRGAFNRLDALRGWPLVRPWLEKGDRTAIAALNRSNFARLMYLALPETQ